jgi:hypothetical protein
MARHHFVPQFLLRRWATDGRFFAYHWSDAANRVIENARALVTSACMVRDLNTFFGVPRHDRDYPEVKFFTPKVDTPAANALDLMFKKGVGALSPQQRLDWARLLVSLGVRTPETLREMGPAHAKDAFKRIALSLSSRRSVAEKILGEAISRRMRDIERNAPLEIAMDLTTDPAKLYEVAGMKWWLRRWDRDVIVIGDRPLVTAPRPKYPCGIPLDRPDCLIGLPVSPRAVFFACGNPKTQGTMRRMSLPRLATLINEESIWRATSVVYACDGAQANFIMPKLEGKALGTWRLNDPRTDDRRATRERGSVVRSAKAGQLSSSSTLKRL